MPRVDATVPDYLDLPLGRFLDLVASRVPAPGGGASAAVAVTLAAALSSMSARFSTDHLDEAPALAERAEQLRGEVMPLARADAAAYARVFEAYRADSEKEGRRQRIREALLPPSSSQGQGCAATLVEVNVSAGGADEGRLARARELTAGAAATQQAAESAAARRM